MKIAKESTGEGKWQPIPVLLHEKSHGLRSLLGYSPKVSTIQLNHYAHAKQRHLKKHRGDLEKEMATHSSVLGLENSMDRGDWPATVHGVMKSWT